MLRKARCLSEPSESTVMAADIGGADVPSMPTMMSGMVCGELQGNLDAIRSISLEIVELIGHW